MRDNTENGCVECSRVEFPQRWHQLYQVFNKTRKRRLSSINVIFSCYFMLLLLLLLLVLLLLLLNTCHERTRERPAPRGTHASFNVRLRLSKSPSSDFIWRGTTARDFVARGRPLRGQKRVAPLAKRSTRSKSTCGSVA